MRLTMFQRGQLDFIRQLHVGVVAGILEDIEDRQSAPRDKSDAGYADFAAGYEAAQRQYKQELPA